MEMRPVIRPANATPPQAEQPTQRAAVTARPFPSVPSPMTQPVNQQPQQVFVSQGRTVQAAPNMPQPSVPPGAQVAVAGQPMPGQFEKAVSQVLTFFFGDKKDKTEEKELRKRNEYAKTGLMGEDRKVEESSKGELGGGQS